MENFCYDIIYEISRYLGDKDLFNLLVTCRMFRSYIELYYERKNIRYYDVNKYRLWKEKIKRLYVECDYLFEHSCNILEKLYYKWKGYMRIVKKKTYISTYRYIILIKPVCLNLDGFNSLRKLEFDKFFNEELPRLPDSLRHIIFGKHFNKSIDNLPNGIEKIEFDYRSKFNQMINKYPDNLKEIVYGKEYIYSINNLPNNVEIIDMKYCSYNNYNIIKLPSNLKILILRRENKICCNIPNNTKVFAYEFSFFDSNNPHIKNIKWLYGNKIESVSF